MSSNLAHHLTAEEELEIKQAELNVLNADLAQRELELAALHDELQTFEREYDDVISARYIELDRIEAQISAYTADLESSRNFNPSDSLKKLYREIAKRIHPDLATDETERQLRQELMIEANRAYEEDDEEHLLDILQRWESSPESVKGQSVDAELLRVLRKLARSQDRLQAVEEEIVAVQQTELHQLKNQVVGAEKVGRNLLEEMATQLDEQITKAQKRLEDLKINLSI
jgi:DnaJ-domain-containing protein 1